MEDMAKTLGLTQIGNTWHLRFRVPKDVVDLIRAQIKNCSATNGLISHDTWDENNAPPQ